MISIIIPAFNEEKQLPGLLECIRKQTYKDYEIIVADADSTDRTKAIARKFGCRVIKGGLPAVGRNKGAKIAKGSLLVFFDADSLIEPRFLKKSMQEFEKRELDAATVRITPDTGKLVDKVFLGFFNYLVIISQTFYPHAIGACIFCKKTLHDKIGGFDETVAIAEDMDYVRRCGKIGKFRILNSVRLVFSMRRYEHYGRLNITKKILLGELHRLFIGELRRDVFNYKLKKR